MLEYITDKAIFWQKQTLLFVLIFILFRVGSLLLLPYPFIMSTVILLLMFLFAMLYFNSPPAAFLLLLMEFFLGGSGHFFEMFDISLRSLFLICFLVLTVMHQAAIHFYHEQKHIPTSIIVGVVALLAYVIGSAVYGVVQGHSIYAVRDAVPYFYLLIIFPAYAMYRRYPFLRDASARLAVVSIIGTSLFSLFNFVLFSSKISVIHGPYYKWFRDVNIGKITDLGDNFFRIVEPSHILIVPLLLIITSLLMRAEKHHWLWWTMHALLTMKLMLNFSRGYLLALLIGLIVLLIKHKVSRWFSVSVYTAGLYIVFFLLFHTVASGFTNPGFDELGLRTASIANPAVETSSATRMMLLPGILDQIKEAPFFGQGLGSEVIYTNTLTNQIETNRQYDWGYFELLAELGIIGTLLYLFILLGLTGALIKKIAYVRDYQDFYVGILAGIIALMVMHITAPVLTHVFGIFSLVFAMLFITKPTSVFDQFVIFLYQLFHKKTV